MKWETPQATDFRFGIFYDPGDFVDTPNVTFPRLLQDSNNDSGNAGSSDTSNRWAYSQGYGVSIPIGTNVLGKQMGETQIAKRMNDTAASTLWSKTFVSRGRKMSWSDLQSRWHGWI